MIFPTPNELFASLVTGTIAKVRGAWEIISPHHPLASRRERSRWLNRGDHRLRPRGWRDAARNPCAAAARPLSRCYQGPPIAAGDRRDRRRPAGRAHRRAGAAALLLRHRTGDDEAAYPVRSPRTSSQRRISEATHFEEGAGDIASRMGERKDLQRATVRVQTRPARRRRDRARSARRVRRRVLLCFFFLFGDELASTGAGDRKAAKAGSVASRSSAAPQPSSACGVRMYGALRRRRGGRPNRAHGARPITTTAVPGPAHHSEAAASGSPLPPDRAPASMPRRLHPRVEPTRHRLAGAIAGRSG
jgi:hypothetical protein